MFCKVAYALFANRLSITEAVRSRLLLLVQRLLPHPRTNSKNTRCEERNQNISSLLFFLSAQVLTTSGGQNSSSASLAIVSDTNCTFIRQPNGNSDCTAIRSQNNPDSDSASPPHACLQECVCVSVSPGRCPLPGISGERMAWTSGSCCCFRMLRWERGWCGEWNARAPFDNR